MDVTVKGLFWLLEEFRDSPTARQFILIGGDAGIGHFYYRHDGPVTEATPHMAYPGCYALSKVLEEVMLEQFGIQYGTNGCCLRAPWIMEKDDFKYTLSFGDDVSAGRTGRRWCPKADAERYAEKGTVPLLRDADGRPLKRNFVHVDDLVAAILAAHRQSARRAPALQHLHGPAGRLRRGRRLPEADARPRFDRHPQPVPLELDGQQQGQVLPRLAAGIRSRKAHRLGLGLRAIARTILASGIRVDRSVAGHATCPSI